MKRIVRSFFLAPFIIYVFNRMAVVLDCYIPINFFSILIIGLFDIPGLIMLIVIYFYFF
ncbi:MAG: pro-sigmaK processing inhibitor BofA family protein [Bacilli bacterium]|nr:pro-sigmaK processing inhibitor BofA family protein [Bacilli bacterium]